MSETSRTPLRRFVYIDKITGPLCFQPPRNKKLNLLHKDQASKPRKFEVLPLAQKFIEAPTWTADPMVYGLPLWDRNSESLQAHSNAATWTSKMAKTMDPTLPILSILGYWAMILGSFGGPGIIHLQKSAGSSEPFKEANGPYHNSKRAQFSSSMALHLYPL